MSRFAVVFCVVLVACALPALALDVDRETVGIRAVEPPLVNVAAIDFDTLSAEVAFGELRIGKPVLLTTKTWCVPEHSDNKIKDAVEIPTYYYEIPYETDSGVLVVRDGSGAAIHTGRLDPLESTERFGYGQCRYWYQANLEEDFQGQWVGTERAIDREAAAYFERVAARAMDDALFFNVLEEKVPLYRFKDKRHDYADLDRAFELARAGYAAGSAGQTDLWSAVQIWEAALAESDLNEDAARINRKVSVKLYESLGVAQLVLGDYAAAVDAMDKSLRYAGMVTSRSNGTGTQDLMERARERRQRDRRNPDLPVDPAELDRLIASVERHRGRVPLRLVPSSELARLRAEHVAGTVGDAVAELAADADERREAVEAGRENPYERQVGRTATQGFYLFVMPYPEKLGEFPTEVCELTQLNQLRMPKHGFGSVPEAIGNLTHLEMLDLSGNNIERFPDTMSQLTNLTTLKVKDNPLQPGELERLQQMLPGCKIKG